MRKVVYSEVVPEKCELGVWTYPAKEKGEALFLAFGVDYEQLDMAAGMFSTAIIELEDGVVKNIPVEQIRFISGEIEK
ncbi:hypothetical protein KAR91_36770 [Candidatus Pacearchaeota archaeon]|nr:hypothetical protein [Candidatus Pacearchaeota archaeon]